jgi:hypothetical protein
MTKPAENIYENITQLDIELASFYYPILVSIAKNDSDALISYSELVETAKKLHPENTNIQNAIAVSTGRRLDVVRRFTNEKNYPDITSIVVNKSSGECGQGFTRSFNPTEVRTKVYSFDWSNVASEFDVFVAHTKTAIVPRKAIKDPEARQLMFNYYTEHKLTLPKNISDHRDFIIDMIKEGFAVEEAFNTAINAVI